MTKRIIVAVVLASVLIWLFLREVEAWRAFDWHVFWREARDVRILPVVGATLLIYLAYVLRALRWKILLAGSRSTSINRLLAPTVIGFTALALLGRPGELIRPYLIARKERLTFASQIAVWTVERIFDLVAFVTLVAAAILTLPPDATLPFFDQYRRAVLIATAVVAAGIVFVLLLVRYATGTATAVRKIVEPVAPRLAQSASERIRSFGGGLKTIRNATSFFQVMAASFAMWILVAFSYKAVINAFPAPLSTMPLNYVLMLMGAGLLGSLIQLPGGGGQQLFIIVALVDMFAVPRELAVGCGILIWLATFMAPVPVGLVLLRREHLSLRKLSHGIDQSSDGALAGNASDTLT